MENDLKELHEKIDFMINDYVERIATAQKDIDVIAFDELGSYISQKRKESRLSQEVLATMTGLSIPTIRSIEQTSTGSFSSIRTIMTVLGLRVCMV